MAPVAQSVGRGVLQVKGGARQGLLASVTDFEVGHHMWFWVGDWSAARHRADTATGELPESRIGIPTASIYGIIWSVEHLW